MRIRWRNFELPSSVQADKESLTPEYGRFIVEPFEKGFGHTIGNGIRRVLLSSIEGTAVHSVKIEGADHEFASLEGIYEDLTDIILNLKCLRFDYAGDGPMTCRISKSGKGTVTGADVEFDGDATVVNRDLVIATLTLDREFSLEMEISKGRGYVNAEENRSTAEEEVVEIGRIPIDAIYSPVHRVRYSVEATRVGKFTNYDRLILEIWTDGTIDPELALIQAAKIYRKHLNPFVLLGPGEGQGVVAGHTSDSEYTQDNRANDEMNLLLDRPLSELELSVRARNCLDSANLHTLNDLVSLSESEVIKLKNLGKTSLTEIKGRLAERGLSLGMGV